MTVSGPLLVRLFNRRININEVIRREEERQLEFALQASMLDN